MTKTAEFGDPCCRAPLPGECRICGVAHLEGGQYKGPICDWADDTNTLCNKPECIAAARAEIGFKPFPEVGQ